MSLGIVCDVQMVGAEFGVKNMKTWVHPALSQRFRLVVVVEWCVVLFLNHVTFYQVPVRSQHCCKEHYEGFFTSTVTDI